MKRCAIVTLQTTAQAVCSPLFYCLFRGIYGHCGLIFDHFDKEEVLTSALVSNYNIIAL